MIHLIIGGARSGKSTYSEKLALENSDHPAYIATAEPSDEEMKQRIAIHKQTRKGKFSTFEEPVKLGEALRKVQQSFSVIMIDCLTVWLGNLQHYNVVEKEISSFLEALKSFPKEKKLFIVTNEVGEGLVPASFLSRQFRDMAGFLNQKVAKISDKATFIIAGLPLELKK